MNFNDLLQKAGINPKHVIMLRHRPFEPKLNKVLPWLAAEKPDLFNAYQQTQPRPLERAMEKLIGIGHIASFIRHGAGKALFTGLYKIESAKPISYKQYWKVPAFIKLKNDFDMIGFTKNDALPTILYFTLELMDNYLHWKGKLVIGWPPPDRSWWRRAHQNDMPFLSILEDSALNTLMPAWNDITLSWQELQILPVRWRTILSQWRGIYYIHDDSDGSGYIGSACGNDNILGRWLNYADSGHGDNILLKSRNPNQFHFSILERVSPDMDKREIVALENSWKKRLHTRAPNGLNKN